MDKDLLRSIFLPTLDEALKNMDANSLKLAHYTSFEVALSIIEGEAVWMRDVAHMNDIGEVRYGIQAVDAFISETSDRQLLVSTIDGIHAGLGAQIVPLWQMMRANISTSVYISCFSEHLPGKEDFGRLSMWRAYCCKPDGVALVLNTEPFRLESNALNAYSSPVFYGTVGQFHAKFREVLANITANADMLRTLHPQMLLNYVIMAILFGAVCLKHPGFSEEKEWRIIHMSMMKMPTLLRRREVNIRGKDETIFEIPLKDVPEQGLVGIEINDLLHQIVIGPSNRTEEIRAALIDALTTKGVENPAYRIVASEIPLRVDT
ncbi:DUF2971 domain-containing protein [Hoeflea sp. BAL378]|uniref:DUF2971 domain-containing protein n=1 Tax=Hoeflea sp. BAL378 TaxID=1547437 RepID=UPI001378903F|nr:DUF2971 domain-containing protein [Hoeflea sp. BAL378]